MKVRSILIMLFASFLFSGCSIDGEEEPIVETFESKINGNNLKARKVTRPFKGKGSGTFQLVENTDCGDDLFQVSIDGKGNATHLGLFTVILTSCTNFSNIYNLSGVQTAANGDELYFYSTSFGMDEKGNWTDYIYDGGTGRFENATGEFRLYGINTFTSSTGGYYTNQGYGTISY